MAWWQAVCLHTWGWTQGEGTGEWAWQMTGQAVTVGMEWGAAVLLSLLENKNTTFSNCCLLPLENMGIINELPIKKIACGRKRCLDQSGSRMKQAGGLPTLALVG